MDSAVRARPCWRLPARHRSGQRMKMYPMEGYPRQEPATQHGAGGDGPQRRLLWRACIGVLWPAPQLGRWAPRAREEKPQRKHARPGDPAPRGRASHHAWEHHPTRGGAPPSRAGSPQRRGRSPMARAGTARGVRRGPACGTAGTGPPCPRKVRAWAAGPPRLSARVEAPCRVRRWRPSRAWPGPVPRSAPGWSRAVAPGTGHRMEGWSRRAV